MSRSKLLFEESTYIVTMFEGNIVFFIFLSTEYRKRKMDAYGISSSRKKEREREIIDVKKIATLRNLIIDW